MQENVLNSDNLTEVKSVNNFKNCKICKMSISTITEYKMHIKEHRRVCIIFVNDNINYIIIYF
jgi:hypothetical protein